MKTIKELRQEKGYTQLDMANKMDIGLSTYQQKEQGYLGWGIKDLIKIRKILNTNLDDLADFVEYQRKVEKS